MQDLLTALVSLFEVCLVLLGRLNSALGLYLSSVQDSQIRLTLGYL